jgi:FKBP-type peptidyl-prolyl cis-trans isomerase
MKKIIILSLSVVFLTCAAVAQNKKPAPKTTTVSAKKTTSGKMSLPVFKNLTDSASYAIGLSVINFYKQQGVTKLNASLVAKAIEDIQSNKPALINEQTANNCMMNLMNQKAAEKSAPNIAEGEKFLVENKKRKGVITTASGLQYEIVRLGDGEKPSATDSVTCHYSGRLLNGTVFDESYNNPQTGGKPVTFTLTRVIAGWVEGLQLMPTGSKFIFYVPYQLGYGPGDNDPIPGGSTMIFEIELIKVIKTKGGE